MRFTSRQHGFRHEHLPNPRRYYERALGIPARRSGWVSIRCCFHEDDRPSLSINLAHGGFRCHACGAKGGDVLAFHMQRHGLGFKAAVLADLYAFLGADPGFRPDLAQRFNVSGTPLFPASIT